jgi:hypothetical protein
MKNKLKFLFSISLLLLGIIAFAQEEAREFDQEAINSFKANEEFQYEESQTSSRFVQILFIIIRYIVKIIYYPFSSQSPLIVRVIFYLLLIGILVYAIVRFAGVDLNNIFAQKNKKSNLQMEEEEIFDPKLEKMLQKALAKKKFRLALRYLYLLTLQKLSENNLIKVAPGKTATEYIYEIENEKIKKQFHNINYYFEYGWYGNFPVDSNIYSRADDAYNVFKKEL